MNGFGMLSPFLAQQGMGMTPGAGEPPRQSNAPQMPVPQMPTPQVMQPPPMPGGQQQQGPMNPAQMGMLASLMQALQGGGGLPGQNPLGTMAYGSPAFAPPSMTYGGPR